MSDRPSWSTSETELQAYEFADGSCDPAQGEELASCRRAKVHHRIAFQAVIVATGISATGHRDILGLMVGDSESKPFSTKFLRSLRARGL